MMHKKAEEFQPMDIKNVRDIDTSIHSTLRNEVSVSLENRIPLSFLIKLSPSSGLERQLQRSQHRRPNFSRLHFQQQQIRRQQHSSREQIFME